ncbi:alcohol dehydrogenase catalytic domain-containing protein [Actinomycetospora straminea]|uniref:NAD(P)-dependent alcohol dehydrogenase n=1 Tax=Actinomycetospora straminea TaxID=663607 RepID=A0ABP9EK68_9PSEU|nr:alcohol dehydrogenase catalytic domain-containing protein [Actinomycetospora straminea]MDD7933827.1 alcohol dehydrogenase catalytic domain-containing protein [Actinomycetospora straminea]
MLAYRMTAPGSAELVELPTPDPGPGQVRLDVLAAGVCHSDLAVLHGTAAASWELPFTFGHEVCGRVAMLGEGAEGLRVGEQVVVHAPFGCGRCPRCVGGRTNYCDLRASLPAAGLGLGVDGGMAEALVVDAVRVVSAEALDPVAAATLTDAGLTSFHAVQGCREVLSEPGAVVVVIGVGGLGHLAIGVLRALGSPTVVAVDTREEALGLARECGADVAVLPDGARAAVGGTGAAGADVVLDFAGAQGSLDLAVTLLRTAGELVVVGSGGGSVTVSKPGVLPAGAGLRLPFWGSRPELEAVVGLARGDGLVVRTTTYDLVDADRAFADLHAGRLVGRAVLVPPCR